MRILIVNTYYYPNMIGGAEHSVKILAENLKKIYNNIAIYCIDSNNKLEKTSENGITVYRGKAGIFNIDVRSGKKKSNILTMTNKIVEMRNYSIRRDIEYIINDFKPDIIHTNNLYGISPIIWKISKKHDIKVVHTIRDYWLLSPTISSSNIDSNVLMKIYRNYFRNTTKYVDVVTSPSEFTIKEFIKRGYFYNSDYTSISNAIEIDYSLLIKILNERRKKNSHIITFMFVGALTNRKGIMELLKTFTDYKNENVRLVICGDGVLREKVEKFIKNDDRISLKGKLNTKELIVQYINGDVLIVPSIWEEPFGRVVIEANQYGLPVIGSDRGGIKEILLKIQTGELYDSNDLNELKVLIDYFSCRNNINKYFDNIMNNIMLYSVDNQIMLFDNLYKTLIREEA